jgi:hypothetical protein
MSLLLPALRTRIRCPIGARGLFDVFALHLGLWIAWVKEHGDKRRRARQLTEQLEPFRTQLGMIEIHSSQVAAGPVDASNETILDRVASDRKDDRNGRGCRLGRECRSGSGRGDGGDPSANHSAASSGSRST